MRIPAGWLGEYVDLPESVSAEHLHAALVKVGFEEEAVHGFGVTGPVVVGRVLECTPEPQSNGKTINWCQVDVGEPEPRGIVCGAHNFVVGDKVVVSLPGAVLPGPFPISARKTYGHVSDGMIASARELGLGDEHDGILVLASLGLDPEVGSDAIELLGLDDFAVEINVTPDRGYAFSVRGVAREYALSTGAAFRDPASLPGIDRGSGFAVSVDDRAPIRDRIGCSVFVTRTVRGIDPTRPTPAWMIGRLALAGIRSISLSVDITNYVMLELGQPLHAYDLHTLDGGIVVRRAAPGETLTTLDDQVRSLDPQDLLIADGSGPIGLAGVMGGLSTEITPHTVDVLIEAANFDPVSIGRSARRHKLISEASRRFERGVDPDVAEAAAARVVQLLVELAGGTAGQEGSCLSTREPRAAIALQRGAATRLIGVEYGDDEVSTILETLGAVVEQADDGLLVTPPSWRPDLTGRADLIEEVARIAGYDRIPSILPVAPPGRGLTRGQRLRRAAAQVLAAAGSTEVLAHPFVSAEAQSRFAGDAPSVRVANPLDATVPFLRRSLLPGLIEVARRNLSRGMTDLSLFEIGQVFLPSADRAYGSAGVPAGDARPPAGLLDALLDSVPPQEWRVGALVLGDAVRRQPGHAAEPSGIVDALAIARQLALAVGARISVAAAASPSMHPGRTAEILVGGTVIGVAGELLPELALELDLPRRVALLELDLDALIAAAPIDVTATPISAFPAATQDLSLVVSIGTPAEHVLSAVRDGCGALLDDIRLTDDYRGTGVPEGSRSLTFAMRFRASDRTLTAAEATEAKLAGSALAAERFGAAIRD
ncbi:MAG: hypothetical protein RI885_1235 [Actinomycetota bacterium]|jgi:phenylalanyl-tRNA synthetase beta chain